MVWAPCIPRTRNDLYLGTGETILLETLCWERMRDHRPSRTAIAVAILRATHQLIDSPLIFEDPLALQILKPYADKVRDAARKDHPSGERAIRYRTTLLCGSVTSECEEKWQ